MAVYVSHGKKCPILKNDLNGMLVDKEQAEFQGQHEEADMLMAFHGFRISGKVVVGSSTQMPSSF